MQLLAPSPAQHFLHANPITERTTMNNNSPLESLVAFAIVFAIGALSTFGMGKYIEMLKNEQRPPPSG